MDASPLAQQEIFGRFVLLEQLDAHGAETCRAVDLERELQPIVTVRRLPRWDSFARRERLAFEAAGALRAKSHGELLATHVDAGEIEGVPYWAAQYVPGVSLDRVIQRGIERGGLSKGLALTATYCAAACLLDLSADRYDRCDNALVAPLVHPRRFILSWTGRPIFLGASYEQVSPDDEERRFSPPDIQGRVKQAADAYGLAGVLYELCTGLHFSSSVSVDAEGPLGGVPVELRRSMQKAFQMDHGGVRELMHLVEPLMKAAGGGHFSEIARELEILCGEMRQQETMTLDKEAALARKLRKHVEKRRAATAVSTCTTLLAKERHHDGPHVPPEMVLVGGGLMRSAETDPSTPVEVKPFLIDRQPVTHSEFHAFLKKTGRPLPASWDGRFPEERADAPITNVTPEDAEAYARSIGKRLPSDIEWELASRGFVSRLAHAWEWTSTAHPTGGRIVRGGPWRNRGEAANTPNRSFEKGASPEVTFRCASSLSVAQMGSRVEGEAAVSDAHDDAD